MTKSGPCQAFKSCAQIHFLMILKIQIKPGTDFKDVVRMSGETGCPLASYDPCNDGHPTAYLRCASPPDLSEYRFVLCAGECEDAPYHGDKNM